MKSYKDIGCRNCGAVLPMEVSNLVVDEKNVWFPGKKCPMCGSQEFYPSIKPSEPVNVKSGKEWKYNPWYGIVAISIVVIFIPIYFFVLRGGSKSVSRNAILMCEVCKDIFPAQISGKPPFECPKCKKNVAYGALFCRYDFVIYPWKKDKDGGSVYPACPVCGKMNADLVKDESHLADIKMKRKRLEEFEQKAKEMKNAPK
jgi:hypothetical protein